MLKNVITSWLWESSHSMMLGIQSFHCLCIAVITQYWGITSWCLKYHHVVMLNKLIVSWCWGIWSCHYVGESGHVIMLGNLVMSLCWGVWSCHYVGESGHVIMFGSLVMSLCWGIWSFHYVGESDPQLILLKFVTLESSHIMILVYLTTS